jgi:uridine phosphorylase
VPLAEVTGTPARIFGLASNLGPASNLAPAISIADWNRYFTTEKVYILA